MVALPLHPFAVDVRASRFESGRFSWTIRRSGVICRRSVSNYESFEEARLAMKAALNVLVTTWEGDR